MLLALALFLFLALPQGICTASSQLPVEVNKGFRKPAVKLRTIPRPNLDAVELAVKEQLDEAWSELQAATQNPMDEPEQSARAYGQMGMVYQAYDFLDAAETCYLDALALSPKQLVWSYYLGRIYQDKGQIMRAIHYLELARDSQPNDIPMLVFLAEAYVANGQAREAKELYSRSLRLDPTSAVAMAGLGKIALADRDYTKAIKLLEQALKLQPEASSLRYPLALAYRGNGDLDNARLQLAQQGSGRPAYSDPLGEELEALKRGQVFLWTRGNKAMRDGRYADAVQAYKEMISLAPEDDPLPRIYLGMALAQSGLLRAAIEQYTQVLKHAPRNSAAHYNLGVLSLQLNSEQEAIEHFRMAVESNPGLRVAYFQLANVLMKAGDFADAIPAYSQVIKLSPHNEFSRLMQSLAYVRLQRFSEAKGVLEESVKSLPESTDLRLALARLLAASPDKQVRDGPRSLRLVEDLVYSQPSPDFELMETYTMALAACGRFREAAEIQKHMIAEVEAAGRPDLAAVLKRNLELYARNELSKAPWQNDDPIFNPQAGKTELLLPEANTRMAKGVSISQ